MSDIADREQTARLGQEVRVDLGGLETDGLAIGPGIFGIGKILQIAEADRMITVQLDDAPFGDGHRTIKAPAERVQILDASPMLGGPR
jgi:hypothetical protein